MGPGQDPPRPDEHFQHLANGSDIFGIRREPGSDRLIVTHRWPERPA